MNLIVGVAATFVVLAILWIMSFILGYPTTVADMGFMLAFATSSNYLADLWDRRR